MKTYRKRNWIYNLLVFVMLCCIVTILFPVQAEAKNKKKTKETKSIEAVLDYADVLTKKEEAELKKAEASFAEETGKHCFVIITRDRKEYEHTYWEDPYEDSVAYNNAFYDSLITEYGEEYEDCSILLLTLPKERYALVSGYGQLEYDLEGQCDWIFEKIKGDLGNGNYVRAGIDYMNYVHGFTMEEDDISEETMISNDTYQTEPYDSNATLENEKLEEDIETVMVVGGPFLIALGLSFVIITIMIWCSGGIKTTTSTTYLDRGNSRVVGKYDNYIRTKTRRIRIEDNSNHRRNSSGRSRRSRGGGTHGGGSF